MSTSPPAASSSEAHQAADPVVGAREWAGLAVLTLPVLLVSMDMTVLHLAVTEIAAQLHPDATEILWIVDVYGFMVAGLLISMGALDDRIGRRRLLLIGAAAFAVASVAAALAPSPGLLIAARAALGVAGATLAPSTLALIRTMFPDPRQRSVATSVWVLSFLAGAAVGPVVGGLLLQAFWWGSVFLLGVPVMALLLITGPVLLPEHRNVGAGRADMASAGLSLTATLATVWGLKEIAAHGARPVPSTTAGLGVLVGAGFVRRQHRLPRPLVDLSLLRSRPFTIAVVVLTLGSVALAGIGFLTVQHLQLVLGLSPLAAGLWTLPPLAAGITAVVLAQAAGQRLGDTRVIGAGLTVAAVGLATLGQVTTTGLRVVVVGLALLFTGLMPVLARGVDTVTGAVPPQQAGAASALSETTQELGSALGIAALGSVATAVYQHRMQEVLAGQPQPAANAAAASLAGALGAEDSLSPDVLTQAVAASTEGLQVAATTGAAVVVAVAVATVIAARQHSPPTNRTSR